MRRCLDLLPVLVIFGWLLADAVPRFFQGDSISYLMTRAGGWVPPDRSWLFGFISAFLLRHGHGPMLFILLQTGFLAVLTYLMRGLLGAAWRRPLVLLLLAMTCLDPVVEVYTRFFMSDFLAFGFFLTFLIGLHAALRDRSHGRRIWLGILVIAVSVTAAIFMRVAYAAVTELTLAAFVLLMLFRLRAAQWGVVAIGVILPPLVVGLMIFCNSVVFAKEFPGERFTTKLSGVFLAGVFAPAIQQSDFANAGLPVTRAEFQSLHLDDYDKRVTQVWGSNHDDLHQFLKDKLAVKQDYTANVDAIAGGLVKAAFRRAPVSLGVVYLRSAWLYAQPHEWKRQVYGEMGLSRPLPQNFVDFFNTVSVLKITPSITAIRSSLIRCYGAVAPLYPVQLVLGLVALAILLVRERGNVTIALLGAALLADLAAVPLYSNYLIARYILPAIYIDYLLIGLCLASLFGGRLYGSKAATAR